MSHTREALLLEVIKKFNIKTCILNWFIIIHCNHHFDLNMSIVNIWSTFINNDDTTNKMKNEMEVD